MLPRRVRSDSLSKRRRLPTETRGVSWPALLLSRGALEVRLRRLLALTRGNCEPFAAGREQPGQIENLPHVIRRVGHRAEACLAGAHRLAADRDGPVEIEVGQTSERVFERAPAVIPALHDGVARIAGGHFKLRVALSRRLLALARESFAPTRTEVAADVLDDERDRIDRLARLMKKRCVVDARQRLLAHLAVAAELGPNFGQHG